MSAAVLDRPVVLVVTQLDDPTADLVIAELNHRGAVEVARVDPGEFPGQVTLAAYLAAEGSRWEGRLRTSSRDVDLVEVRSVYWRRPTPYLFPGLAGADAAFAAAQARAGFGGVLACLPADYLNHPQQVVAAESKPVQLAAAAALRFNVPPTLITSDPAAARAFVAKHDPVVFKPLSLTGLDDHDRLDSRGATGAARMLWTQRIGVSDLADGAVGSVAGTAHLFQAEVVKSHDLRITVVAGRVFCVRIDSPRGLLDWRTGYSDLTYKPVEAPPGLEPQLLAYLARFGLRFGCFDFAVDHEGAPWFLECNPNGQWAWLEPETGLPLTATFADVLEGSL